MLVISKELLENLVNASYRLAAQVRTEDVLEEGAEREVVLALRSVKREVGVQARNYILLGDLHEIMDEPPSPLRVEPMNIRDLFETAMFADSKVPLVSLLRLVGRLSNTQTISADGLLSILTDARQLSETDRSALRERLEAGLVDLWMYPIIWRRRAKQGICSSCNTSFLFFASRLPSADIVCETCGAMMWAGTWKWTHLYQFREEGDERVSAEQDQEDVPMIEDRLNARLQRLAQGFASLRNERPSLQHVSNVLGALVQEASGDKDGRTLDSREMTPAVQQAIHLLQNFARVGIIPNEEAE